MLPGKDEDEDYKGQFAMQNLGRGLADAFAVCARPSFGEPKTLRVTYKSRLVSEPPGKHQVRKWFRELPPPEQASIAKIEKFWPEAGWELVYENGKWI